MTTTTQSATALNPVIAKLTDPTVKAAVTQYLVGNTLSYAGMLAILQSVAAHGVVTASEFASLKTLVASFNTTNGIQVSAYLAYISNALINGNAANAQWTGGASSSVALGNLVVGSSAAQLNELIGKWFLGTDLPTPTIAGVSGTISYVADNAPLFNSSGLPSVNDINQGDLGDCYLLASLAEVAQDEPQDIASMITANGNGTYAIRFFVNGAAVYVTVNNELPLWPGTQDLLFNSPQEAGASGGTSDIWASLVEKAYAQLNAELGATDTTNPVAGNSYSLIGYGYTTTLTQVTGRALTYYSSGQLSGTSWNAIPYSNWLAFQTAIVSDLQSGEEIDFNTGNTNTTPTTSVTINGTVYVDFVPAHVYSVIGYNPTTGEFELRNPWGTQNPGFSYTENWQTTFYASMSDFYNEQGDISVASGAPAPSTAVVVSSGYTSNGAILVNGDTETVLSGGAAVGTAVNSGGSEYVYGTTTGTNVNAGGIEEVFSGGTASSAVVNAGGVEAVYHGGTAVGTVVGNLAFELVSSGGKAIGTIVNSGGSEYVSAGGKTSSTMVNGGGVEYVYGTASGTTLSGGWAGSGSSASFLWGEQSVESGGIASGTVVDGGGWQQVFNGGKAVGAVVNGGFEYVYAGGTATGTTEEGGGNVTVYSGGKASGTVISSGGQEYVTSGGIRPVLGHQQRRTGVHFLCGNPARRHRHQWRHDHGVVGRQRSGRSGDLGWHRGDFRIGAVRADRDVRWGRRRACTRQPGSLFGRDQRFGPGRPD